MADVACMASPIRLPPDLRLPLGFLQRTAIASLLSVNAAVTKRICQRLADDRAQVGLAVDDVQDRSPHLHPRDTPYPAARLELTLGDPLTMTFVPVRRLHPEARLPTYATDGAAGADLYARLDNPLLLPPGGRALVPTGLAMALPKGFELQIRPRSGLALKHGITVLNTPGTVDSDYRGEIGVILLNTSDTPFTVSPGDRIAQAVLARHETAVFAETDALPPTARGAGGFGSTGWDASTPVKALPQHPEQNDRSGAAVLQITIALTAFLALAIAGLLPAWTGAAAAGGIGAFLYTLLLLPTKDPHV